VESRHASIASLGAEPIGDAPEEFAEFLRADMARWHPGPALGLRLDRVLLFKPRSPSRITARTVSLEQLFRRDQAQCVVRA
jgi:hypothetical protein